MTSFLEHAVRITAAMNRSGLWDETDGFYYDALKLADGSAVADQGPFDGRAHPAPARPLRSRPGRSTAVQRLGKRFASFLERACSVTGCRPA